MTHASDSTLFLTFHQTDPGKSQYSYAVNPVELEKCLVYSRQRKTCAGGPVIHFTFDDGYQSNLQYAVPLLEKYAVRAIFFVTVDSIGSKAGFMGWSELRELVRLGYEVQSHSLSHPFLTSCTDFILRRELEESKQILEDKLGAPVELLSCPGGRCNRRVVDAAQEAGYRQVFTSNPWKAAFQSGGVEVIGRLNVSAGMTAADFDRFLSERKRTFSKGRIKQHIKEFAQGLLGDRFYHLVWAKVTGWNETHGE